ncbi:hypothetical protein ACLKA6_010205, partial [Drosophila palustris]
FGSIHDGVLDVGSSNRLTLASTEAQPICAAAAALTGAGENVDQKQRICSAIAAALASGHLILQPGGQLPPASGTIEQHQLQSRLR